MLNSSAKTNLIFMNFLLESIITYKLSLPLSKISVSLRFDNLFRCDGVRLDMGGSGDDDGDDRGGDDD